jgi:ArsR family transcriptional regulator
MARTAALADVGLCCSPLGTATLDDHDAASLAQAFAALSDPVRLKLLSYIASAAPAQVCACDLTTPAGRSQPTVSHHMKILVDAGLVDREKRGLWVWYRVVPEQLVRLRTVLA